MPIITAGVQDYSEKYMDRIILIEEYRSLRAEILKRQDARLLLIGFTITGIAALLGLMYRGIDLNINISYQSYLTYGIYLIIIISLVLTILQTVQINLLFKNLKLSEVLASYLERFTDDLAKQERNARIFLGIFYITLYLIIYSTFFSNNTYMSIIMFLILILLSLVLMTRDLNLDDYYEYLIDLLHNDEDKRIRIRSAKHLGEIKKEKVVNNLIRALNEDKDVRTHAKDSLVKIEELSVEPLINNLKTEDKEVRKETLIALGQIGDIRAVDYLIEGLEDILTRGDSIQFLGQIGGEKALMALIDLVNNDDKSVRKSVALALGNFEDNSAFQALIKLLDDEDDKVKAHAVNGLRKMKNQKAVNIINFLIDMGITKLRYDDYISENDKGLLEALTEASGLIKAGEL